MRQAVYGTARLGLFFTFNDMLKERKGGDNPQLSVFEKVAASFSAGGIGSFIGTPFDVCLVRMQGDMTLPPEQRRNYKHVFDALRRIPKEEGITGLWKGAAPTMARAIALNIGMMVSFEEAKERLRKLIGKGKLQLLIASAISGVFTALFSLPFDNMKTKLQKMKQRPDGTYPYKGLGDCLKQTMAR